MPKNRKITPEVQRQIHKKLAEGKSFRQVGAELGVDHVTIMKYARQPVVETPSIDNTPDLHVNIKERLTKEAMTVEELADACDCSPARVRQALAALAAQSVNVTERADGKHEIRREVDLGGRSSTNIPDRGDGWQVFGATGDWHLCSKHERLDVLEAIYDRFSAEGVTSVYHTGNMIDGEARFNRNELHHFGMQSQVDYFCERAPKRPGITTYFVTGDDHEGWYAQRECVNIGEYIQHRAEKMGRTDLRYLSNVEHDVELKHGSGRSVLRVMHPGGGSSYALSYVSQKIVESFQGGEKPHILLAGHYHKFDYCYARGVHVIQTGCAQDQSTFMRKRKMEAHVGAVMVWLKQDQVGAVERLRVEWMPFFDRGYYGRRYE